MKNAGENTCRTEADAEKANEASAAAVRTGQIIRLVLYALVAAVFYIVPVSFFEAHPLCPIYNLTGFKCPMCGMTRAFAHMFRLHVKTAVSYNPLVLVLFPAFAAVVISDIVSAVVRASGREKGNIAEAAIRAVFR